MTWGHGQGADLGKFFSIRQLLYQSWHDYLYIFGPPFEGACHYCGGPGDADGLRPYGPGGLPVCAKCALSPEHEEACGEELRVQFVGAMCMAKSIGLTNEGPMPLALAPPEKRS